MRSLGTILVASALAAPSVAWAAPTTLKQLAEIIVTIINSATGVLVAVAIVIYFMTIGFGLWRRDEGKEMMRTYLVWGLLVIFVMVSIWGILYLLQETLFGGASYTPSRGPTTGSSGAFDSFGELWDF